MMTYNRAILWTEIKKKIKKNTHLNCMFLITMYDCTYRLLNLAAKEEMFSTDHCVVNNNVERTGL